MFWTDEELVYAVAKLTDEANYISALSGGAYYTNLALNKKKDAELYRLARLGLAAEAVGLSHFGWSLDPARFPGTFDDFLAHPAWAK